ncbi:Protein ZTF-9, partial [Aphelenchoides avenae]
CEKCRFAKFPTEYAVRNHYEKDHGLSEYYIRYRVSPDIVSRREQTREVLKMSISSSEAIESKEDATLTSGPVATNGVNGIDGHLNGSATRNGVTANVNAGGEVNNAYHHNTPSTSGSNQRPSSASAGSDPKSSEYDPDSINADLQQLLQQAGDAMELNDLEDGMMPTSSNHILQQLLKDADFSALSALSSPTLGNLTDSFNVSGQMWPEQSPSAPATTTKRKRVPDANRPTVKCNECQQMVANYSTSFIHHVNVKHLRLPMLRCLMCEKTWTSLSKTDTIKHVKSKHNGDEQLIEDNRKKYWPVIGKACEHYFDHKAMNG